MSGGQTTAAWLCTPLNASNCRETLQCGKVAVGHLIFYFYPSNLGSLKQDSAPNPLHW
ncbi:Doubtful cds (modular protein) [Cupriavidus neocaledonicus]|uniref:Doubtful cds (Modular protein) n=1 Tax=Cupriavidus neocaledonicus TaxID=1040979 RepID=A0A375H883_9BURK|nr:doubtful cds (modular protein) [Cupriavidus neocaledonicus]SPD47068.1 Doubtful cds (modular protein) [Cupriavidus neocaledonicus]